ncbi:beta-ribofuranosylaminobenzene 5'-phosphate synthase [Roseiconus nitratireducens]|uniref:Beta-ribofuranosylaminobenzene 5'-phosphate synthase n=1 Tax=Roseiconus nitratireducens TaxID=2605748 RepID=A0A5M6DDG5_9BACT|nr:beta-ribofuranosylaminobenzene 5'-phosphate synthase [Roseiconus nitratireducens]KAA5544322.1 beta-ribofuranosylaminobenzene 5'-phosphate synthase [Roseiconus nitratireducens]
MELAKTLSVQTGARLHFGLLDTVAPFGGLGVMIDQPRTEICFGPAEEFSPDPAIADRARPIVRRWADLVGSDGLPELAIEAPKVAPAHSGYGSGTQQSLAIAEGLCNYFGRSFSTEQLARVVAARGKRSAVGIHGYFRGGLIFEASARHPDRLNEIQERIAMPETWRVVLFRPVAAAAAVSGERERKQFAQLRDPGNRQRDRLRTLINDQLLPAARAADFSAFSDAVQRYNRLAGMLFADVQGGPYNGPVVSELIERLDASGAVGIGQSSWGPGVFAWCIDQKHADALAETMAAGDLHVQITRVRNEGRRICRPINARCP